jgi:hypothetical protein
MNSSITVLPTLATFSSVFRVPAPRKKGTTMAPECKAKTKHGEYD